MIPLCNGFYLFPLSRAVNSNSLIFDPSEFKIGLYIFLTSRPSRATQTLKQHVVGIEVSGPDLKKDHAVFADI